MKTIKEIALSALHFTLGLATVIFAARAAWTPDEDLPPCEPGPHCFQEVMPDLFWTELLVVGAIYVVIGLAVGATDGLRHPDSPKGFFGRFWLTLMSAWWWPALLINPDD